MNKKYTLQANHEIEAMLAKKQSVGSKYYVIHYDRVDNDVKIAVSVSKKLGDAHIRNYQKRVTKEILRSLLPDIKNVWILVVVKASTLDLSFEEKIDQIRYVIKKLNSNINILKQEIKDEEK